MAETSQRKKLLIVNIIDILNRYTDETHTLTQREIERIMESEYEMTVDRKAVHRNLVYLIESGVVKLQYTNKPRMVKNASTGQIEETNVYSDFAAVRDFTESELRFLIDGIYMSDRISAKQRKELLKKLEEVGGRYFASNTASIKKDALARFSAKEMYANICALDEAIQAKRKVRIGYKSYEVNRKYEEQSPIESITREFGVSAYALLAKDGTYYLICNIDGNESLSHFRLDRIVSVVTLEEKVRAIKDLPGDPNVDAYIAAALYRVPDEEVKSRIKIKKCKVSDFIDEFGDDFKIRDVEKGEDGFMTIVTLANVNDLIDYVKCNAPDVVLVKPKKVAARIKRELADALTLYKNVD